MNKKGLGFGFIRLIAIIGMFLLLFALALAPVMSTFLGAAALDNASPLESWLLRGMNVWIFIGFIIFVIGALVYGFGES